MGLLGLVGPGLTAATTLANGAETGQISADQELTKRAIEARQAQHQATMEQLTSLLNAAKIGNYGSMSETRGTGVTRVQGEDGQWYLVPKNILPGFGSSSVNPAAPESSGSVATGGEPPATATSVDSTHTPQPAPRTPPIIPTGIKGRVPTQRIDPLSSQGISADSVRTDNRQRIRVNNPLPPTQTFVPVTTTAPDGSQVVSSFGSKTGTVTPTGATAKTSTGVGGGIGSLTPGALAGMRQQALDADRIMSAFERDYAAGHVKLGASDQALGSGTAAHPTGLLSGAAAALSRTALGATNPRYQQYLAAQQRFGNIMGNLMSRRYTEHQGVLDTNLAGMATADAPSTIGLKQSFRRDLIDNFPTTGRSTPAAPKPSDPTAGMSDADAWEYYASHGASPDQATAKVQARKK